MLSTRTALASLGLLLDCVATDSSHASRLCFLQLLLHGGKRQTMERWTSLSRKRTCPLCLGRVEQSIVSPDQSHMTTGTCASCPVWADGQFWPVSILSRYQFRPASILCHLLAGLCMSRSRPCWVLVQYCPAFFFRSNRARTSECPFAIVVALPYSSPLLHVQ